MGGLIRKALIYFSFYIRSLDLVVAKRKFITSALVKCREHAMMKPALWSVAGNLPFLRDVRFSLPLSLSFPFLLVSSFCPLVSLFRTDKRNIRTKNFSPLLNTFFSFFNALFLQSISKWSIRLILNCSFYNVIRLFRGIEFFHSSKPGFKYSTRVASTSCFFIILRSSR